MLDGATAWRTGGGDGAGSRTTSRSVSETGSVRVLQKVRNREKLVTIPDNNLYHGGDKREQYEQDGKVYNDTQLSRRQPWRSRYPTPHELKEQLARRTDSAQNA